MGFPAARLTDLHLCPIVTGVVSHVGGIISAGEATVLIGKIPAARILDSCSHGGTITEGCPTVLIGG